MEPDCVYVVTLISMYNHNPLAQHLTWLYPDHLDWHNETGWSSREAELKIMYYQN